MAFKLGDIIIDRLQMGYAEKSDGTPLHVLTQLTEATINITADSQDITDKDGTLVYRQYKGKQGEVNAANAFLNLRIIEALSASDAEIATEDSPVVMPIMRIVESGNTLDVTGMVDGSVVVSALSTNGSLGTTTYTLGTGTTATASTYIITETDGTKTLSVPTDTNEVQYLVKFKKEVTSGTKITNSANKFPTSYCLYFKALAVDPCDKENLKACVIEIPSFMPSPEMEISVAGGDSQTMNYNGAIMVDYCSIDKTLFNVYFVDETEDAA